MSNFITPIVAAEDIFQGGASKEFEATPPGKYKMALKSFTVKRTQAGEAKLEAFFTHTDAAYKGVTLTTMLEGTDKNGKPKAKQTADLLVALGASAEDVANGNFQVALEGEPEAGAEWKGVPASIYIKGDRADFVGKEAIIAVEASTYQGKTKTRGAAAYRIAA